MSIELNVIRQALRQGGCITREQLLAAGLSDSAITRRLSNGDLTRIARSVYAVVELTDHLDLIRRALLALPTGVASHQSAAHLLAFPHLPPLIPTVTVQSKTTHRFPNVTVRRTDDLVPAHLTKLNGIQATNVVRTVFDLGGILPFDQVDAIVEGLVIADRMKIRHLDQMHKSLARQGKRGSDNVRMVVAARGTGHVIDPTVLERKGRAVLAHHGLPPPVSQYPIPWDPNRRFDDAYPPPRLALEWDSHAWHSQKAAIQADRERNRNAALHDWILLRFTWADVTERPNEVAESVATLLRKRGPGA